jgi:hypothetical protein
MLAPPQVKLQLFQIVKMPFSQEKLLLALIDGQVRWLFLSTDLLLPQEVLAM